jgi:polyisoprenoid-binding protein YceI
VHPTTRQIVLAAAVLVLILVACSPSALATSAPTQPIQGLPASTVAPPATEGSPATSEPASGSSDLILFVIQPEASQAQFQIDEILAGSPNTVIGTTSKVAGEIHLDPAHPDASQVGPITVETSTLVTDNSFRNRAIGNFILQSGAYPLATFTPTALAGMPASVAVGETFKFTLIGDLTLRDITKPVTFEVTVTAEAADRISGKATATVQRSDFALTIPSVPQVAGVSEDVLLEFSFTAQRSS